MRDEQPPSLGTGDGKECRRAHLEALVDWELERVQHLQVPVRSCIGMSV